MQTQIQETLQQWVLRQSFNVQEASRFSPTDFRLGVQWLVEQDHIHMPWRMPAWPFIRTAKTFWRLPACSP
jgi:hypothetical protein